MTQIYNPQWDRYMNVDNKLFHRMTGDNFTTSHTGGGCFAWERNTDDGGYIWITDESGAALGQWAQRNKPLWLVGRYNIDGDFITVDSCTLPQAMQLADTLRAPTEGEATCTTFGAEDAPDQRRCQHRDDGRGRCIDCGAFLDTWED